MTTKIRFILSSDFSVRTDLPLYLLFTGFLHVASRVILDCNAKMYWLYYIENQVTM